MPTVFHPHPHRLSLPRQITVKLFRFLAVWQSLLSTISSFGIHKRNLLEARVIIASYNDHCSAPFSRAFLVGSAPPSLLGPKEPTLSWNQSRSFYEEVVVVIVPVTLPSKTKGLLRGGSPGSCSRTVEVTCTGSS